MDIQLNLPDRLCQACKEAKGYMHFLPATPYRKEWNATCLTCREAVVREPLPALPLLECSTCGKPRAMTAFVGKKDGAPSLIEPCFQCRLKEKREKGRATEEVE